MTSQLDTSTSTKGQSVSWWAQTLLRGMGQVFFMDHPLAGALMLAGLLIADPWLALFSAVGIVIGSASATAMRVPREQIGAGLHGYCAGLVGGAAYTTWGLSSAAWASALLGSVAVVPVTLALAALLTTRPVNQLGLSVLTAPFCLVSGVVAVWARGVLDPAAPLPAQALHGPLDWVKAMLTGIGQVVFADSAAAGALILAGLFVASWRAGVGATLGAGVTTVAAVALGWDQTRLVHGLEQYSAVLVAIAVAAVFLVEVKPGWLVWAVAVLGSLATLPIPGWLSAVGIPVYTWPFILVTWVIVAGYHLIVRATHTPNTAPQ